MSEKHHGFLTSEQAVEKFNLDLKNRRLAGLLAWLVPGLGHFYQGRNAKGALFLICITSLLVFGMYVGRGDAKDTVNVAYASTDSMAIPRSLHQATQFVMSHWKFACQAGVGAVAIPALIQRDRVLRDKEPLLGGFLRPPYPGGRGPNPRPTTQDNGGGVVEHPDELAKWNHDRGFYFELGSIYAVVAGLLNILAVYDAAAGPLISTSHKDDEDLAAGEKSSDKEVGKSSKSKGGK